jgi:short-subunit dehydrogenase
MSFARQVAVITGASSGIGHALARALAAEGCKVGLMARRRELLEGLQNEIRKTGGTAEIAMADVARRDEVVAAIHDLAGRLGPVDLLVANAGVGCPTRVDPLNVRDTERVFGVNFFGALHCFEAVLPAMLARGQGHLAAVSSLGAYKGLPGESSYTASKAALNTYLDGLRVQLRRRGVAVTTICPGFVRTPMIEGNPFRMPWMMDADRAAKLIVGALRRRRKVFNFPWQTTLLMKFAYWAPDWLLARVVGKYTDPPPEQGGTIP